MKLLRAVNRILGELGEHPITSIENKNPSVAVILQAIGDVNYESQVRGWWFNQFDTTLYPGPEGNIQLPEGTLDWDFKDHPSVIRGDYLINPKNMSQDWNNAGIRSVSGVITIYVDFEDLPPSFAEWVTAQAGIQAYTNDTGIDDVVSLFMQREQTALNQVMNDHVKAKRYSTRNRRMYKRMVSHIWR